MAANHFAEFYALKAALEIVDGPPANHLAFAGQRHGSLYDRGRADSYYRRSKTPHYGGVGGDTGPRVEVTDPAMVAEYNKGYDENNDFKDWG